MYAVENSSVSAGEISLVRAPTLILAHAQTVVNSLVNILHNRAYIGEYKWGGHIIPGGMPQIISLELFDAADKKLSKNKRGGKGTARKLNPEKVDFWLTGHIYCGECGAPLHGISGTSKTGNIYYYYSCLNHKKKVCKMSNQPKEKLGTIVRYTLDRMLEDSTLRLYIAKMKESILSGGGTDPDFFP